MDSTPLSQMDVPSFYCPFPYAISPEAAEIDRRTVQWMDDFGLHRSRTQRDYLATQKVGYFASLTMPHGSGEGLQVASDQLFWLFTFDDMYCDEREDESSLDELVQLLGKLARILEAPTARMLPGNPWAEGLRDIRRRLDLYATPVQTARWVEELRKYLFGLIWEAVNRSANRIPRVNDYVAMWLNVTATAPSLMFIDISAGYEVSAAEMSTARVRALTEMANALVGWDNDIISFNKEAFRKERYGYAELQNLVSVLAHQNDCSIDDALTTAVAMRDRVMSLFLRLSDEVKTDAGSELTRYVHGLGEWVRGYLEWSMITDRYGDPRNPDDEASGERIAMPRTWKEEPMDDSLDPLPVTAINWWWDQLDQPHQQI
ncbi:terpene synthase [Acrocarpospora corrugata]|uniref:Terpene synthase n=1 Tax=Acrocarpospora corrugata TaxID=35763 RepID=A0A5M3VPZ9_9ACTN|nr:terpene synthase [Acrocarpospora corrugata]GER98543.1 terpene synthase [Acrocarpospora corrugata]